MDPSITLTLDRGRDKITVNGTTTLPPGTQLTVSVDVEGKGLKTAKQTVEVGKDGSFTWSRKLPQGRTAKVTMAHGGTRSNEISAGVWSKGS